MKIEVVKKILEARVKLFPVRDNFKYVSIKDGICCRWCERNDKVETEYHIFNECRMSPKMVSFEILMNFLEVKKFLGQKLFF